MGVAYKHLFWHWCVVVMPAKRYLCGLWVLPAVIGGQCGFSSNNDREMTAQQMQEDLKNACRVLQQGGVILYPTDTIWGLGCDAANEEAVRKIFAIKERADSKAMLVLAGSEVQVERHVAEVPEVAWQLMEVSDKPLTIIYPGAKNLAPSLVAADGSVGIRLTREAFSQALCMQLRRPVVSTSANKSGSPSPANFSEVAPEIVAAVDYVVRYRQDEYGQAAPSSIIKLGVGGEIEVIRK